MTDNRDSYREAIQSLARERKGKPFPSADARHASVAVETLFLLSERHVRLLTGRVDRPIFSDPIVISAARRFLSRQGTKISVILSEDDATLPFFGDLSDLRKSIETFALPPNIANSVVYRFIVGDEDMYRLEGDKDDLAGVVAYGDVKFCSHLILIFEQLKKVSKQEVKEAATA